jgi:hypothetical protein
MRVHREANGHFATLCHNSVRDADNEEHRTGSNRPVEDDLKVGIAYFSTRHNELG